MPRKSEPIVEERPSTDEAAPVLIAHMVLINGRDFTVHAADAEDLAEKVATIRATL